MSISTERIGRLVFTALEKMIALDGQGKEIKAKELAKVADEFWITQQDRLQADKVAKALKQKEDQLQALLVSQLRRQEMSAIGGKDIILEIKPSEVPLVNDWQKFYAHILETQDFSLLERRPGRAAIKERWDDEKTVPGVEKFPVYKLSRRQVKG